MAQFAGGCLTFVGVCRMFDVMGRGIRIIANDARANPPNVHRCDHVARIAASVLNMVGQFFLAIGLIVMGGTLMALAPEMIFATAIQQAVNAALPYLGIGLTTFVSGLMLYEMTR